MAKARRAVSQFVGGSQCAMGVSALVLTFLVYASPSLREGWAISFEEAYMYMFLFVVFGILSIISGLLLVRGESGGL